MASSSEGSEGSQSFRQRSHSNPALPFRTASKSRSPPASEISAASTFRQRSQSNAVTLGGPREQALRQAKEQSRRRTQSNATAHGPPSSRRPQRAQSKSPQNLTSALVVQLPIIPMDTEAVAHVGPSTSSWSSSSSLERIDVKNLKFSDHSFSEFETVHEMAAGFAEENAAQGQRLGPGLDSNITADTVKDTRKHMTRRGSDGLTSLRVYATKAIYSPGTQYKAVTVSQDTTSRDVITMILDKLHSDVDKDLYELRFTTYAEPSQGKLKRVLSRLGAGSKRSHVLGNEEAPVLVAEWFADHVPRRFELHRRASKEKP